MTTPFKLFRADGELKDANRLLFLIVTIVAHVCQKTSTLCPQLANQLNCNYQQHVKQVLSHRRGFICLLWRAVCMFVWPAVIDVTVVEGEISV